MAINIAGTGCVTLDNLYIPIDFSSDTFKKYLSIQDGDGGLSPGKLVFTDDLAAFGGAPFEKILSEVTGNKKPVSMNGGGPCAVALIHAAQALADTGAEVYFHGARGDDEMGDTIAGFHSKTPLHIENFKKYPGSSPFTDVLSDPDYSGGQGERTFINNIGAAWNLLPENIPEAFYSSDIVLFGGTALTPRIHQNLTSMLDRCKTSGCLTVVGTVYDFQNQQKHPESRWALGQGDKS
jgi:sugar/nucleoside kinase (ribokinase family)